MKPVLAATLAMSVIGLVAAGGVIVLVVYLLVRKPTAADVAWLAGGIAPDADAAAFYCAYLTRQLRFRSAGGLIGVIFAAAMAVRYEGELALSIGAGPIPLTDPLFMGVAGVIVGGLAAESYRIGWRAPAAEASLDARGQFAPPKVMIAARLSLVGLALVAVAVAVAGWGANGCLVVAACAVPVALAEWTQRAILDRRRPAGPPEVIAADEAVRSFAGRSAAWLELAIIMLALGRVAPASDEPGMILGLIEFSLVYGSFVLAIYALIRSGVRAPRAFRRTFAANSLAWAQGAGGAAGPRFGPAATASLGTAVPAGAPVPASPDWAAQQDRAPWLPQAGRKR
ncbi:MAG: hypothetical protein LBE08_00530 [Bifidobacteriaceae bacterium]|jgi:hypothetical protein|nr:hypothetical protein [Bifidobacteriaceae bacterium]